MIDPKRLDALKLPLKATIVVFLATGALFFLDLNAALDLGSLGSVVRNLLLVALVLSTVMSLVWTSSGVHNEDHYSFSFDDFAWFEIIIRHEEFLAKDDENKSNEAAAKGRIR